MHVLTGLGRDTRGVHGFNTHYVLDLLRDFIRVSAGKIDFIDDRNALKIVVQSKIHIAQRLGLHALGRVDDENGPVAGSQRSRHFIIEVDMAGGIDQVEDILLPVIRFIDRADGLRFDGYAAFTLEVHVVKDLLLHFALSQKTGHLNDPVRKRGLTMIYMGYDTKITDFTLIHVDSLCGAAFAA